MAKANKLSGKPQRRVFYTVSNGLANDDLREKPASSTWNPGKSKNKYKSRKR